jgi:hypothetical protein
LTDSLRGESLNRESVENAYVKKGKQKNDPKLSLKGVKFEDALKAMLQTAPERGGSGSKKPRPHAVNRGAAH